jgi:hypothetical protein
VYRDRFRLLEKSVPNGDVGVFFKPGSRGDQKGGGVCLLLEKTFDQAGVLRKRILGVERAYPEAVAGDLPVPRY